MFRCELGGLDLCDRSLVEFLFCSWERVLLEVCLTRDALSSECCKMIVGIYYLAMLTGFDSLKS